jgi:trigger factor
MICVRKVEDRLLLTLRLQDKSGKELLLIHENELIYSTSQWNVEFVGKRLTIREGARKIICLIDFHLPHAIYVSRGHFSHQGTNIQVNRDSITNESTGLTLSNCWANQSGIGGFAF